MWLGLGGTLTLNLFINYDILPEKGAAICFKKNDKFKLYIIK
jgi:hypothetical protein